MLGQANGVPCVEGKPPARWTARHVNGDRGPHAAQLLAGPAAAAVLLPPTRPPPQLHPCIHRPVLIYIPPPSAVIPRGTHLNGFFVLLHTPVPPLHTPLSPGFTWLLAPSTCCCQALQEHSDSRCVPELLAQSLLMPLFTSCGPLLPAPARAAAVLAAAAASAPLAAPHPGVAPLHTSGEAASRSSQQGQQAQAASLSGQGRGCGAAAKGRVQRWQVAPTHTSAATAARSSSGSSKLAGHSLRCW